MEYEFGGRVDLLVFGDSHVDLLEVSKGVLLINPGSPTFPRQIKGKGTVALLEIDSNGKAKAQIISISTRLASQTLTYQPDSS